MKNWLKVVLVAETLTASSIPALTDTELNNALAVMESEGADFPPSTKHALILRKVRELIQSQKYQDAVLMLNPFHSAPMLAQSAFAMLAERLQEEVRNIWPGYLQRDDAAKWLHQGSYSVMLALSSFCLEVFSTVDMVELDHIAAQFLDETRCILNCLVALLTPTLQRELQASHWGGVGV